MKQDSEPKEKESEKNEKNKTVVVSEKEYEALKEKAAKADENWDTALRSKAELENTRKRLDRRSQELVRFANEDIAKELLPIVDDINRAVSSLDQDHDLNHVKDGLLLINRSFETVLRQHGVEPIQTEGKMFDPHWHEAVEEVDGQGEEGLIAVELQKGFKINGRLLRPSKVKITKKRRQ
jgi:molecular chaperone GrpE